MKRKPTSPAIGGQSTRQPSKSGTRAPKAVTRVHKGQLELEIGHERYRGVKLPEAFVWVELPEAANDPDIT